MAPVSAILTTLAAYFCITNGLRTCITPERETGRCMHLRDCPSMLQLASKTNKTQKEWNYLRKSDCSIPLEKFMICCPNPCYTPEAKPGKCVDVYSCPHLLNLTKSPTSNKNMQYVHSARCMGKSTYSVCCGPPPNRTTIAWSKSCSGRVNAFPPVPRSKCCGLDSRVQHKIKGGTATLIEQYPWLVLIEYVKMMKPYDEIKLLCGGTLISARYVLTAGHCVTGKIFDNGTPKNVRLGEYNTKIEGADCRSEAGTRTVCTDGMIVIPIETMIPHPDYLPKIAAPDDIALIRLAQNAPFTNFIRPICLPSVDITATPARVFSLYAAGWGKVGYKQNSSDDKLHVALPYVENSVCEAMFESRVRKLNLTSGQMCAGGVAGKDSCNGDSGGPLMYQNGRTFELIGVTSFGHRVCGSVGVPGVYTKVYDAVVVPA